MAYLQSVQDLIVQAIENDSTTQLSEIFKNCSKLEVMTKIWTPTPSSGQGETLLISAIKTKRFNVIDFLVRILRECVSDKECRSLCLSTFCQIQTDQISIVDVMECLIDPWLLEPRRDEPLWLEFLWNCIKSSSIPRQDKIDALELIGAAFIFIQVKSQSKVMWAPHHGLQCWKDAMALRYSTGERAIPKTPNVFTDEAAKAFADNSEVLTLEELELMEQESSIYGCPPAWGLASSHWKCYLRVQALLVNQRVVSQVNNGPYYFHLINLIRYGWDCNSYRKEPSRAFNICLLIIDQAKSFSSTASSPKCIHIFVETLDLMSKCFERMREETAESPERRELTPVNLLKAIGCCTVIANLLPVPLMNDKDHNRLHRVNICAYDFVSLLFKSFPRLNQEKHKQLEECLSQFIPLDVHRGSHSLLHAGINRSVWLYESNTQRLIQLFLKMGVDPNATDRKGKTPLHILAEKWNWTRFSTYLDSADFPSESLSNVFQSLVEAGGHLDQATPEGHTVIDFLEIQRKKHSLHDYYFNSYLNSLINTVLPLSCYCAQSLRQHKIPLGNQLPPRVHSFILRHSALKR
jgi:hypothetical protein